MEEVTRIKRNCHKKIYDTVTESAVKTKVIRYALENQHYQSCKVVAIVPDAEQATKLKAKCESIITSTIKDISTRYNNVIQIDIKYRINIIAVKGDVYITENEAEQRRRRTGDYIIELLEHEVEERKILKKQLQEAKQIIKPENMYTLGVPTGTAYRCTYYDKDTSQRKQINVNNILIVIGDDSTNILDSIKRKERANKKQAIFKINVQGFNIAVYE